MTEACREQYPLLHEDLSEEERFTQRRMRPMAIRSRVRNKVKGAASIFQRWPGYWSTAVVYWWIGLGMIVITTLLIYNGITVFALIPSGRAGAPWTHKVHKNIEKSYVQRTASLPDILMHVHVNEDDKIDFNKYLPYIEILKKQYSDYTYHLIIVINDMYSPVNHLLAADESKYNEIALNSLLDNSNGLQIKDVNGVVVERISLTKYLDSSPLKKNWRNIPHNFLEFLVRAVSIWEKGGIAFNPIVLTPHSPHSIYIEKILVILKKYMNNYHNFNEPQYPKESHMKENKKRQNLNNIRDIIEAMEQIDNDDNEHNEAKKENIESLETAESRFINPIILNIFNDTKMVIDKISSSLRYNKDNKMINNTERQISQKSKNDAYNNSQDFEDMNHIHKILETENTTNMSLPVILKYLLNEKDVSVKSTAKNITRKRKGIINRNQMAHDDKKKIKESLIDGEKIENNTNKNYKSMIVSLNVTKNGTLEAPKITKNIDIDNNMSLDQLTIDLKGNILATKTPCHAFIGTLFSNVVHHDSDESITEFIIHELTSFCKGLLSSCNGIDVILL